MHPQKRIIIPIFAIVVLLFAAGLAAAQAPQPGATRTTVHPSQLDAAPAAPSGTPLGSGFSYQGQLLKNGVPVNGECEMVFKVWNNPAPVGGSVGYETPHVTVTVTGGLFTVPNVDWGGPCSGFRARSVG